MIPSRVIRVAPVVSKSSTDCFRISLATRFNATSTSDIKKNEKKTRKLKIIFTDYFRISLATRFNATSTSDIKKNEKKTRKLKESSSFAMNLFRGQAVLSNVFPYPMNLNEERKEMLHMILQPTEKFLAEVNDPVKNDEDAAIPKELLTKFAELGAFGALVPEQFEGAGLNNVQMARLAEVVGANDLSLAVVMGAHQSIGYKGILLYGTDEQKKKYLPDLATGRRFAAFCLTEASSGSDANSIRSRADKTADGKYYILNGGKLWISNAGFADVFTVFAQSIGYKGILLYGTDEQKKKYLPDLATGRRFAAFCLTEASSGSDANSIRSRADKTADGKYYILNGGKLWISNAGFADVFTVFAQTPVQGEDGITKDKVSAFIVERSHGGVTHGPPEKKMGIKGSNTAEINFENTKVPVENLLGKEGEGFKVAMNILNNGRFGIPAACTGSMKWCIKKTVDHITERTQFGKKLKDFGNVQEQLVDMITRHYATESILYMLASNMDKGVQDYQLEAAIGKVMASENAWRVCDAAIQLHGGMGYMKECGLERVLRDLRIFRIFEGANDVLRLFIALTGLQVDLPLHFF
uniref:Very long-chain specific acyl-CoA dehydrogenase, mitochondrial n=1 Tax=Ascaris lumbricoides TaxID=6252 RepID=A0A0M3IL14_ASCLU